LLPTAWARTTGLAEAAADGLDVGLDVGVAVEDEPVEAWLPQAASAPDSTTAATSARPLREIM